jgi:hypothetical protein
VGVRALVSTVVVVVCVGVSATPVSALPGVPSPQDDPFFLNWPAFLPAVPVDFTASTENDCPRGTVGCVDNVVREMTRRLSHLACAHDAPFAFVYLRTTQEYRRAVEDPHFFADNAFVNHEDTVFADFYFRAYDRYRNGNLAEVPPAWRIAFQSADARKVTGMGDILLGMNAHINRDLPFVLNAIGLVGPQGASRKPDHDKVNAVLAVVTEYVLQEAAARYDPTIDDGDVPFTTLDQEVLLSLVQAWREVAWRNAELLSAAPTLADRLNVARLIEDQAAATALTLRTTYAYGLLRNSSSRDAYCAGHLAA